MSSVAPAPSYALERPTEQASEIGRLERQAAVPFPLEWRALATHVGEPSRLLDLGPGAGAYLALLAQALPGGAITALEANADLATLCKTRLPAADIRHADACDAATLVATLAGVRPQVVTARYLLQHLSPLPRDTLLGALLAGIGDGRFICIDTDDGLMQIDPPSPAIEALNRRMADWQSSRGGDRFIGRALAGLLERHGFRDVRATPVVVSSQEVGLASWWDAYGPAYRRSFDDFEASAADPDYRAAESWIAEKAENRTAWISKTIHIVSGRGAG